MTPIYLRRPLTLLGQAKEDAPNTFQDLCPATISDMQCSLLNLGLQAE